NFILKGGLDQLDAIEINYQIPITIKGDTITYNADSFTNGTEDKLGDVLKKLPGIEVNEDGDIQVEGNNVEKVMVDGKDFFEGDSRLATKNIPANAVGKVEVLKNYNSQSQLKGLGNDQDRYVINIRLKEGKKKFWFGEATVGAGHGGGAERYLVQPKAFYYSENFSVNILTDFNNLGVPAFTGRDYFRFVGFRNFDTRQNNASINVDAASTFSAFATNRAQSIDSKFGAFNASWKVNSKLDMSAFAIFSGTQTRSRVISESIRTLVPSEDTDEEVEDVGLINNTDDNGLEENFAALFKLGADYNPNSKLSIKYDGRFNISDQSQVSDLYSERDELQRDGTSLFVQEQVDQNNEQQPISFNQNLNMYYTAADNHIFAFETQFLNQREDIFYNAIRDFINVPDREPFNGRLRLTSFDDPSQAFNINQDRLVHTNKLDAKLDYWYVINKTSNINFTAGTTISSQNYDSGIFQIVNEDTRNDLTAADSNNDNVQYDFRDIFIAAHYKLISGKFTFTPGVTLHSFQTTDVQLGIENVIETNRLLPDLDVRYQLRSSESFNLNYNRTTTFSDIENYALGLVFSNYNGLRSGNNQLEGSLNDRISLRYNNFNMFNYTTINGNITYTKQQDAIQSASRLDGINQISTPINAFFPNESLSGNISYGKEIRKIQFGVNATGSWSTFNNVINNERQTSENIVQIYGATARSNFQKGINFDLSYSLNLNDGDNNGSVNKTTRNTYRAGVDWQLGKRFLLKGDYSLNDFSTSTGAENKFDFLNASIRYQKPSSRWQYSLIATNLLNTEVFVQNNFGQIFNSNTQTFVLPRYIYFQMRFDL
ncbi:MAG: outer membrane beta-barrel family protein, partial [Nonlabens sp.]|nr:outer membrane beta-barrel family protein [Nonlabens sp.]